MNKDTFIVQLNTYYSFIADNYPLLQNLKLSNINNVC